MIMILQKKGTEKKTEVEGTEIAAKAKHNSKSGRVSRDNQLMLRFSRVSALFRAHTHTTMTRTRAWSAPLTMLLLLHGTLKIASAH